MSGIFSQAALLLVLQQAPPTLAPVQPIVSETVQNGACGVPPSDPVVPGSGSPDEVAAAIYEVVSGAPERQRPWSTLRALHAPNARILLPRHAPSGQFEVNSFNIDEFIALNVKLFANQGFFENEVARRVERFGHIAHVWSSYESREAPGEAPYSGGINSIQLVSDGVRWCVLSVTWDTSFSRYTQFHPEGAAGSSWTAAFTTRPSLR
ncbi:hypothetical protein ACWPM1_11765 [Tsuneonella sp. HG249]